MNRILSLFLSSVIIVCTMVLPVSARAEVEYTNSGYAIATADMFEKSVYSGRLQLKKYTGTEENIFIPAEIEYNGRTYPTSVNNCFEGNKTVKNVLFENGVHAYSLYTFFAGAENIETALFENNGHFSNQSASLDMTYTFKNTYLLTEYFDLTDINARNIGFINCVSLEHITSLPQTAVNIQINNYLSKYNYTSTALKSVDCAVPASCTTFVLQAKNVKGNIVFNGENTDIKIMQSSNSNYYNCSSLTLKVPADSYTLKSALTLVAKGRHTISVETTDGSDYGYEEIFVLGDSLTAGNYYIPQLNELFTDKRIAYNYGVESDQTVHGMRRMGVTGYEVKTAAEFTVPESSAQSVEIPLSNPYTAWTGKVSQDTGGINCIDICGIKGFITYNSNESNYYFRRLNDGNETVIPQNTFIQTELNAHYKKGDTLVIYLGTNDHVNTTEVGSHGLADKIQEIINFCKPEKYAVIGVADGSCSAESNGVYENVMESRFGHHFLNLREYFIDNAYTICSDLTIEQEEQEQLDSGIIPAEFYNDGLHWKAETGGKVVAQAIYEKLNEINTYEKEHYYTETVITEPTCESEGILLRECTVCGRQIEDTIPATGHTPVTDSAVEATCISEGLTEGSHCGVCGAVITAQQTTPKTDHKYKAKVVQKATFTLSGIVRNTCTGCGISYNERIPKIKNVTLSKTTFVYSKTAIKPTVTVRNSEGKAIPGKYYSVSYYSNTKPGTGKVKVTFLGRYSGSKTLEFLIKSKATASNSKTVNTVTGKTESALKKVKNSIITALRTNSTNESALGEHIHGSTVNSALSVKMNYSDTNYGYGTRIKNPKSPITKIYVKTYITEDSWLTCTLASADLNTEYTCTRTFVKASDSECCFEFKNLRVIDESEIYVLVNAENSVLCEGMTSVKSPNTLNEEIGAANAKSSKKGNVYCADGENWQYYTTQRSDEKNIYSLIAFVYCRNDYYNAVSHTIYVSPDGNDETGDGSQSNPYASIFKANSTITDNSYFNRYTIKVADGEYSDMSTRENSEATRSIICKNYVTYEGNVEHPENCVIIYDGSQRDYGGYCTYANVQTKAIFEISSLSRAGRVGIETQIKGFKLVGRNLRYILHFDTAGGGIGGKWDIGNLIINYQGNPECVNDNAKRYAIGCGMAQFETALYHDIVFEGTQRTYSGEEYKYIYYAHNNEHNQPFVQGGLKPCVAEFRNIDLNGGKIVLVNTNDMHVDIYFNNCINYGIITNPSYFNVYKDGLAI